MALNFGHIYNNPVKSQKFIHLFLIATLCFGQFAASTHIAGHVHHSHGPDHGSGKLHILHVDLHATRTDSRGHAALLRLLELRRSLANLTENPENEEGVDCSIYHAFSSLCGALTSAGDVAVGWSQLGAILQTTESHIARATSDDQRIRAPPHLS